MTDARGSSGICSDMCGCPSPCPGGTSCRTLKICRLSLSPCACSCYTTTGIPSANDPNVEHQKCACGEHCGCNPCTCTKRMTNASGCNCGDGCTCVSCA
ncbi:hypothetical protein RHSIM_Rhsim05G0047200 [Rhododendron simsii]|uniref:Uncharacterized protein n=1 Tax=Rhododendron simsii TaxID=118357 RepID=A0A834GXB8_RHOSS|nr:hypothetical protein RHSIM_Rhsim05G0047200 [Rhododendron simsii]